MATRIYHNPRCSKSRATLALLESRGVEFEVVNYLETPPGRADLQRLLRALGGSARDIVRFNEPEFAQSGLARDADDAQLLEAIVKFPKLLQRPIVEHDGAARIGRPPEAVLELFG